MSVLENTYQLDIWDDTKIKVGSKWQNEIKNSINDCRIAILLVSNNFLSSEFIAKKELPEILKVARQEGVIIFNVIVDTCAFLLTELKTFQCFNDPRSPLEELKSPDRKRVLVKLPEKLLEAIEDQNKAPRNSDLNEESNSLCTVLVLADLVKNGPQAITAIQHTTLLRRKVVVETLQHLEKERFIEQFKKPVKNPAPDEKKKPSTFWKVSTLGLNMFNQFERLYFDLTTNSTK